jgi:hypothetical protein
MERAHVTRKKDLRTPYPGQPRPEPESGAVPEWETGPEDAACPNCGARLCVVRVRVTHPALRSGRGLSTYMGCPACPYASPSVTASDAS